MAKGSRLTGVAERPITPKMSRNAGCHHVITCTSEGDDPSGRRRQGVNRPDDAPAGRLKGARAWCQGSRDPSAGRDREARARAA